MSRVLPARHLSREHSEQKNVWVLQVGVRSFATPPAKILRYSPRLSQSRGGRELESSFRERRRSLWPSGLSSRSRSSSSVRFDLSGKLFTCLHFRPTPCPEGNVLPQSISESERLLLESVSCLWCFETPSLRVALLGSVGWFHPTPLSPPKPVASPLRDWLPFAPVATRYKVNARSSAERFNVLQIHMHMK